MPTEPTEPIVAAPRITSFRGDYFFLSNFSEVYPKMYYDRRQLDTSEHLYQWGKPDNRVYQNLIESAGSPQEARALGRRFPARANWDELKLPWMRLVIAMKFTQNDELRKLLLSTGNIELIEGNTWGDTYWGAIQHNGQWIGYNHLGKILMDFRAYLFGVSL